MAFQNLIKASRAVVALTGGSTGAATGVIITVGKAEAIHLTQFIGDNTGAGVTLTLSGSTTSAFSASATLATVASTGKNGLLELELAKPTYPYVRVACNSTGTAAAAVGAVIAHLHGVGVMPTTSPSTDVLSQTFAVCT